MKNIVKKLLVLGLSACLLFTFTGSAFAATQTKTTAKHTAVHAKKKASGVKTKKATHAKAAKKHVAAKIKKAKTVHKKTATTA